MTIGALGFENAYAIAVPRDLARKLGLNTLDDLALCYLAALVSNDLFGP